RRLRRDLRLVPFHLRSWRLPGGSPTPSRLRRATSPPSGGRGRGASRNRRAPFLSPVDRGGGVERSSPEWGPTPGAGVYKAILARPAADCNHAASGSAYVLGSSRCCRR